MKSICLIAIFCCYMITTLAPSSEHVTVSGTTFMVAGKEIYFNGVNTPWDAWNDFGGASGWNNYDSDWWDAEFAKLADAGINSSRVWITCDGANDGFIYENGRVAGMTDQFWQDCDDLMRLARKHRIYIMATLISFDHADERKAHHTIWRQVMRDSSATQDCIDHFIIPFVDRYRHDPWLYAIDLCNEIEWMHDRLDHGAIAWADLQRFIAQSAAAIHRSGSPVLGNHG